MNRDRLLLAAVVAVWAAAIVVGVLFMTPITSTIYSHDGPEYQLEQP